MQKCHYPSGECPQRLTLLFILILGAVLRLATLDYNDLWHDEFLTIFASRLGLRTILDVSRNLTAPPLYYIILKGWFAVTGGLFHPRMFSVIWAIVGIYFAYVLGRRLFNREAGLCAALFIALAPYHIRYSQEVRMYIMQVTLLTAETLVLISAFRDRKLSRWLLYGVMVALNLSIKYQSIFYCAAEWIFALAYILATKDNQSRRGLLAATGLIVVLLSPVIWIGIHQLTLSDLGLSWVAAPRTSDFFRCYAITLLYYMIAFKETWVMWALSLVLLSGLVATALRYGRTQAKPYAFPLLITLTFLPAAVMFVLSLAGFRIFFLTRYVIIIQIPYFVLISGLINRIQGKSIRAFFVLSFAVILLISSLIQGTKKWNPEWRVLTRVIDSHVGKDDLLLANHQWWMSGYYNYSRRLYYFENFAWYFEDPRNNPETFYLFQNNMVGEIGLAFPAYLPSMLERFGDVEILYQDAYYTFSRHTNVDFKTFREYVRGNRLWRHELETRDDFVYILFADDIRLDNDARFTPAEYGDEIWAMRLFTKSKVDFTVPRNFEPGYYQVRLRANTDFGPLMPKRDVTITVDNTARFTAFADAFRFWYYSFPFQLKEQRTELEISVECPLIIPSEIYDTPDDRTIGLRFYWLAVASIDLEEYKNTHGMTYYYDIGTTDTDGICIGNGIYPYNETDLGENFRWTNGNGVFFVIIDEPDMTIIDEMVLNLRQNHPDTSYNPECSIIINGNEAARFTIGKSFENYIIENIRTWVWAGINTVEISSPFWIPSEVLETEDDRELGLQVNFIGLR